jgi:hypothetical protein
MSSTQPFVQQPRKPFLLVAVAITPELPLRTTQQFTRLHRRLPLALPPAQNIANFCILRSCSHLVRFTIHLLAEAENRTTRVLPNPDNSRAYDICASAALPKEAADL